MQGSLMSSRRHRTQDCPGTSEGNVLQNNLRLKWFVSLWYSVKCLQQECTRSSDCSAQKGRQKEGKQAERICGDHLLRSFHVFVGNYFSCSDSLPERIKTTCTTQASATVTENNDPDPLSYLNLCSRKQAFSQFP